MTKEELNKLKKVDLIDLLLKESGEEKVEFGGINEDALKDLFKEPGGINVPFRTGILNKHKYLALVEYYEKEAERIDNLEKTDLNSLIDEIILLDNKVSYRKFSRINRSVITSGGIVKAKQLYKDLYIISIIQKIV